MILARAINGNESAVLLALCGIAATLIRVRYLRNERANMLTRPNVRRRDRRKLGRGQYPTQTPVNVTAAKSGSTAILTFSKAVLVSGPLPLTVGSLTYVSQVVNSPTQVSVLMSGAVATLPYAMPADPATVAGQKGEPVAALAGTFS